MRSTSLIRNIGIIAHVDAGKTTLSERILLYTGRIRQVGEVHDGDARLDHTRLEKKHGITITAASVSCDWRDHTINLLDTPGHVDFTIEVERSLRVLDGAVCVFDGVAGVEAQTETVWHQADRHQVPRMCFVNKLDRAGADFDRVCQDITDRLAARTVVVTSPIGTEAGFVGVVDVVRMRAWLWPDGDGRAFEITDIPPQARADAARYREALLEVCADLDDEVMSHVVDGSEPSTESLVRALRAGTCAGRCVPVLAGSAYRNRGVQPLLDAVVDYLPDPTQGTELQDRNGGGARARGAEQPLAALCFKVSFDRHTQTSFVRVYSGRLRKGDRVWCSGSQQAMRVSRLVKLFADAREDVDVLGCGEIGALLGAKMASGDTLSAVDAPIALESITRPDPLVHVVVEAPDRASVRRLDEVLAKLVAADSSLQLSTDADTGQQVLSGMGQLHLDITLERLREEHGLAAVMGPPRVAYRQTLASSRRTDYRLKKQTGGPGMFAQVSLVLEPAERGSGLGFVDDTRGGAVPRAFARAVEAGVAQALAEGVDGIAVVDVLCTLTDGATHSKDSSELAFKLAGQLAITEVLRSSHRVVLEPFMVMEATVPASSAGAVIGDLGKRRGRVVDLDAGPEYHVVRAQVPLAETFGYAGALSALTGGRGRFVLEAGSYEAVPAEVAERIMAA